MFGWLGNAKKNVKKANTATETRLGKVAPKPVAKKVAPAKAEVAAPYDIKDMKKQPWYIKMKKDQALKSVASQAPSR